MTTAATAKATSSTTNDNIGIVVDMEDPNPKLSDYERARAKNIVRNNARLRELGLISVGEEKQSNAAAWGIPLPRNQAAGTSNDKENDENDDDDDYCPNNYEKDDDFVPTKKRKAKKRSEKKTTASPSRKSARLQGQEPEIHPGHHHDETDADTCNNKSNNNHNKAMTRRAIVEECRQARQRAALRVMEAGAEKAAQENPTATYEHCLMRVRTMTEKALRNRVKAIERAAGKHCVVKMAIFKSCLQDEDMWELTEVASEALERLKALQAPPEE